MRALLDVSALLALFDAQHSAHVSMREWLARERESGWASCAITQIGFLRIASQPRYTNPIPVAAAASRLRAACATDLHEYWRCDASPVDETRIVGSRLLGPSQITDVYLLALAVERGGRLVTLDHGIPLSAVVGATEDHLVVV